MRTAWVLLERSGALLSIDFKQTENPVEARFMGTRGEAERVLKYWIPFTRAEGEWHVAEVRLDVVRVLDEEETDR